MESLRPGDRVQGVVRRRLHMQGEFALGLLPTALVLGMMVAVEALSNQRLLFASLASSAFLIYLNPEHDTNPVRTLGLSQILAASLGLGTYLTLGAGYVAGGLAMVLAIGLMIALDAVHPPAGSTALRFGLRAGDESNPALFVVAVGMTAALVVLQRAANWPPARYGMG